MKVTFQTGKGNNHLVPVLIPQDLVKAMQMLTDATVRSSNSVHNGNKYVFPSTQNSESHISSWHAVNKVCIDAKVEHLITATKMRHRISTLYAVLDVPHNDRQVFYKHMGHSENINVSVYQVPLAVAEVRTVGSRLQQMDG
jgi:integrase